jgi:hypothetical protein
MTNERTDMVAKYNFNDLGPILTRKSLIQDQLETTMTNSFEIEQAIMNCWNLVDDLDLMIRLAPGNVEIETLVKGLKVLYQMKFEKLFELHEDSLRRLG